MNRLIDSIKDLFATTGETDGNMARTASFTLENVNWQETLKKPEPLGHRVAEMYLEEACANSGQDGSSAHALAEALLASTHQLHWRASNKDPKDGPDVAAFAPKFTATTIIGAGGLLPSDKVLAGFSLQAPDTYYPPHAHHAEESYWIIGGSGDWRVGTEPWFAVEPGDAIYHKSEARHAMQTSERPLLTVWLWTSHLDSEVLIVRG